MEVFTVCYKLVELQDSAISSVVSVGTPDMEEIVSLNLRIKVQVYLYIWTFAIALESLLKCHHINSLTKSKGCTIKHLLFFFFFMKFHTDCNNDNTFHWSAPSCKHFKADLNLELLYCIISVMLGTQREGEGPQAGLFLSSL